MRELEVTKHGSVNDISESKPRHPRRRPFPSTVSEWKERQKEKNQRRLETDLSLSRPIVSEIEESNQGNFSQSLTQEADSDTASNMTNELPNGVTPEEVNHFLRQIRNQVGIVHDQGRGLNIMNPPPTKRGTRKHTGT